MAPPLFGRFQVVVRIAGGLRCRGDERGEQEDAPHRGRAFGVDASL